MIRPNPVICSATYETDKRKKWDEHGSVGAKGGPKTTENCKREAAKHEIVTQVRSA